MVEQPDDSIIAVAWYKPEEWADIRRLCPDLHGTYQEWLADAEAMIESLSKSIEGQVMKVDLTVDELRRWKRATGREVDSKVRSQLAMKAAERKHLMRP
ncbi:hypothetical protein [Bradyrhizobium sp. STM 3557]|uniref:hypothetical protein n=1 Tax=Bradyrhizobium sp. STM 3557 TaxID=578920 RepID=UPI003890DC0E